MSERKVLNKYYPPDFDPSKIPKLKLPKDRQYVVRLMAPFNMRCKTCGEYIYKGKKFNARKETVMNELYMGLPIFRFYIKCTRCLAEITFKTDPENTDYSMEHGATRNFQAEKLIEQEETKIVRDREEEELNNPMKVLENRTRDSKLEMEVLENLQELKELNQRQAAPDFEGMIGQARELEQREKEREIEEDERETQEMLGRALMKRLRDSDSDSDQEETPSEAPPREGTPREAPPPVSSADRPTDILTTVKPSETQGPSVGAVKKAKVERWEKSVGKLGGGGALSSLVVRRKPAAAPPAGCISKPGPKGIPTANSVPMNAAPLAVHSSSLSLLGAYSDSESE
ncbi:splicing factor YJU2 [Gadus chalcogrammus]|uniref:splicing factor YJU2 n=1 Tax=Gadus chalcogrammus TaxID=1042646 RepID=UPI0024C2B42F|nr:splicing factor YJU2 [Gadus chalcogrammus]